MLLRQISIASATTRGPTRKSIFGRIITGIPSIALQRANMSSLSTTDEIMKTNPIAAVAQLRATSDKYQNLVDVATCARQAKAKGASMLFLPECFGFIGESSAQTLQEAEDPQKLSLESFDSESPLSESLKSIIHDTADSSAAPPPVQSLMDGLRTIAKESGLWISGGGMHVSGAPPDEKDTEAQSDSYRVYNTHVVVDSNGLLAASYRKIHLFDVSIPGKVELRESRTTAPGTELVACDSPVGRLGITTCYDLRFPEMYTELTQNMGAQILLVPSAFTIPTGAAHWHILLRARAIENQCYVLAAAQYGKHNEKRVSFGHALAVDPWGKVIADAGGYPTTDETEALNGQPNTPSSQIETPSIVTVEIDLSMIDSIRQRMPIDLHRSNARF